MTANLSTAEQSDKPSAPRYESVFIKQADTIKSVLSIEKVITVVITVRLYLCAILCILERILIYFCTSCSDGVSLMYQRVQKVECSFPRPVLIMGPLVEASKDMLVKEVPDKFCRCLPGELVYTLHCN